ncbi:MAG TPA: N-acetyl-gamma-glutamyl-phosphate reductase [Acidimicrobiia bacterium]|nr:N-acetyl-gamma-glutamyl-phosphate reductase [Acidimicrobiia bacterium]
MGYTAAVLGASGYAGGELVRLLDDHPGIELVYLGAHSQAGRRLAEVHPHLTGGERVLGSNDSVPDVDVVFLALPHGASWQPGIALADRGAVVVDLGSDFRLDTPARYEEAYGVVHPVPESLGEWTYGLPELVDCTGARRIASPGCYPTSALLALAPLAKAGVIEPSGIVVDSMSGVSGAGRSLKEDLLYGAVDEGVRAYAVTTHRHRPEMEALLDAMTGADSTVLFTPHLVPMQRGILSTCHARLAGDHTAADLRSILEDAYAASPFVDVIDGPPQTRWVVGSNRALVNVHVDPRTGTALVLSAIDNLLKGAAGQAVQAANIALGLPEAAGLTAAGWMP